MEDDETQITYLPGVNDDVPVAAVEDADSDDVVEPVVVRVARLEEAVQVDGTVLLRGPAGADEDVGAVVGGEVVARVRVEGAVLVRQAPVGAQVQHLAVQLGPVELAADDGDRLAVALRARADLDGRRERRVHRVEELEARRGRVRGGDARDEGGDEGDDEGAHLFLWY